MTAEDFERRKKEGMERLEKEVKILLYCFVFQFLF
jgi:hypothetical protein